MKKSYLCAGSLLVLVLLVGLAAAQESGTVTRGTTFAVTVSGNPITAYDIWPKGTSSLSGEPGDQPPIIVPGQVGVVQDPPGGPYPIGDHPIKGGGTIRGDVPPDSSTTSATAYYAEVTTDASGYAVVLFMTSAATATGRQFHIEAENPANLGEDVGVVLGAATPPPATVMPLPMPTTVRVPLIPSPTTVPETTVPTTTVPATTLPTTAPTISPFPTTTPAETTPPQGMPVPAVVGLVAAGIGLLGAKRFRNG